MYKQTQADHSLTYKINMNIYKKEKNSKQEFESLTRPNKHREN